MATSDGFDPSKVVAFTWVIEGDERRFMAVKNGAACPYVKGWYNFDFDHPHQSVPEEWRWNGSMLFDPGDPSVGYEGEEPWEAEPLTRMELDAILTDLARQDLAETGIAGQNEVKPR